MKSALYMTFDSNLDGSIWSNFVSNFISTAEVQAVLRQHWYYQPGFQGEQHAHRRITALVGLIILIADSATYSKIIVQKSNGVSLSRQ